MTYRDGETVELGDDIDVYDENDQFEPERATVIRIGAKKIRVSFAAESIKDEWVFPKNCDMIARR